MNAQELIDVLSELDGDTTIAISEKVEHGSVTPGKPSTSALRIRSRHDLRWISMTDNKRFVLYFEPEAE